MPSGTQSYQTTSGSLIDPARRVWEDRDKTKDKIKKFERQLNTIYDMYSQGVMGAASETPMITSASDFMLESGATALPPAQDLIEGSNPAAGIIKVLTVIATDIAAQNQLVSFQTKAITDSMNLQKKLAADSERLRKEKRLEAGEDLSGTQGVIQTVAKATGGGGLIGNVADTLQIVSALSGLNKIKNLGRMFKGIKFPNFGRAANATDFSKVIPNTRILQASNLDSFKPSGVTTSLGVGGGKNIDAIEATVSAIPPSSTVNEIINNATSTTKVANNTTDAARTINNVTDFSKSIDTTSNLSKVDNLIPSGSGGIVKALKETPGLKFLLPGASIVSGGANLMSGNFAEAGLDLADGALDVGVATGAVSSTGALGSTLGPTIAVTGAGLLSGWLGELTRGADDYIRGDGKNAALNSLADLTAGVSGTLETIGAPFTAFFSGVDSLIKTGGFSESNKKMAEVDSNIREGFRKFFNAMDFMDVVSDDVGGFGTLDWYGEKNVDNANKKLLKEKGITVNEDGDTTINKSGGVTNSVTNKNTSSTANKIEGVSNIDGSVKNSVIAGGTTGDLKVDQQILNEHRITELKQQMDAAKPGDNIDNIVNEIQGIESGEINAARPIIDNNQSISTDNTVTNVSSVNKGDINNIAKPTNTAMNVLNNSVSEIPVQQPIIVQVPAPTTTSNESNDAVVEHVTELTDSNADPFKTLTYLSALP